MPKCPYSTKRWKPVPVDFEAFFIAKGWTRSNLAFGKRETLRYVTALGRARLAEARRQYKREQGA